MNKDKKNSKLENARLDNLKAKRKALDAKIQKMETLAKTQARKQDLSRKILIGTYYLEQATNNNMLNELRKTMRGFLKRESDKKLFKD